MADRNLILLAIAYKLSLEFDVCPDISLVPEAAEYLEVEDDEDNLFDAMEMCCGLKPAEIISRIIDNILG